MTFWTLPLCVQIALVVVWTATAILLVCYWQRAWREWKKDAR